MSEEVKRTRRHWTGVFVTVVGAVVALASLAGDGGHVNAGLVVMVVGAGLVEPGKIIEAWKR